MTNVRGIKKVLNPAAGLTLLVLVVLAATAVMAGPPDVDGKFSLVGSAQWVTGGLTPGNKAVDLTSNCGAEAYNATCYTDATFTYSNLAFTLNHTVPLSAITTLSTAYNMNGTDCSGGSPRFVIFTNGYANNYELNIGHPPYGGDCYYGWQNTGNVTSTSDPTLQWQVGPGGPPFYSWSTLLATHGTEPVSEIDIILDGGWIAMRGQDVTVDSFTINKTVLHP